MNNSKNSEYEIFNTPTVNHNIGKDEYFVKSGKRFDSNIELNTSLKLSTKMAKIFSSKSPVIVNDENSAEPSQDETASAQTRAIDLGKAADAVKVNASVKTTITCIKGKLTKKITGSNPKCPAGYKKR